MTLAQAVVATLYVVYGVGVLFLAVGVARVGFLIIHAAQASPGGLMEAHRAWRQVTVLTGITFGALLNIAIGLTPTPGGIILVWGMAALLHLIRDPAALDGYRPLRAEGPSASPPEEP